jgi:hypothetical protein
VESSKSRFLALSAHLFSRSLNAALTRARNDTVVFSGEETAQKPRVIGRVGNPKAADHQKQKRKLKAKANV